MKKDYEKDLALYEDTDYDAKAGELFKAGDIAGAYNTLFGNTNSREAKVSATGNDYGKSSQSIWDNLVSQFGDRNNDTGILKNQLATVAAQSNQPVSFGGSEGDDLYKALLQKISDMNYNDWTKGDQYKALQDRFTQQGSTAMQDTIGQVAARTGGLASSYAATAGQQQYNDILSKLEDVAREAYKSERNDLITDASMARDLGRDDYSRYMDSQNAERQNRGMEIDMLNTLIGFAQQGANSEYERGQSTRAEAQNRIYDYLSKQGGSVGDLDAALISSSGYTTSELRAMEAKYKADQEAAAAKASTSSRSSGGSTDVGKPTLTAAQALSALDNGVITDATKSAYEYYYGAPYNAKGSDAPEDATLLNENESDWVYVRGLGRISYDELERYVESGKVKETYDKYNNTISFDLATR